MITSFVPFFFLWYVTYLAIVAGGYWYIVAGVCMIINAFFIVRVFIIQHDCGHHSFFGAQSPWNKYVGRICSLISSLPFTYWKTVHHHHHNHSGQLEQRDIGDINFWTLAEYAQKSPIQRWLYRLFRSPVTLFFLAPLYYFVITNRTPAYSAVPAKRHLVWWSKIRSNILLVAVYTLGVLLLGWAFLVVQLGTIYLFGVIAFWFFYVQHAHEYTYQKWHEKGQWSFADAALQGASRYDLPTWMHWLTGNIGYHHIHHLNPAIPSYHLPAADQVAQKFELVNEKLTNLNIRASLQTVKNKLWSEEDQRFITFREAHQRMSKKDEWDSWLTVSRQ